MTGTIMRVTVKDSSGIETQVIEYDPRIPGDRAEAFSMLNSLRGENVVTGDHTRALSFSTASGYIMVRPVKGAV
jgi:hypothetical protein